VVGS